MYEIHTATRYWDSHVRESRFIGGSSKTLPRISQCYPPHGLRPLFPYNYSISVRSLVLAMPGPVAGLNQREKTGRYWNATHDRDRTTETQRNGDGPSEDIEEMNGNGCRAKLHRDNYLLTTLHLARLRGRKESRVRLLAHVDERQSAFFVFRPKLENYY